MNKRQEIMGNALGDGRRALSKEVPVGYKRAEVGVIPVEWKTKRFGEFVTIRNEKVQPINLDPETPCVELEHIGQGNGHLLGYSGAHESSSTKYRFLPGDVLFGRLRPYLRKFWRAEWEGICTTEIWPLVVDTKQASSGFLRALVETNRFIDVASASYGTHMPRADWGVLQRFEVGLPRVAEQRAIAEALSDVDELLGSLEKLIAKKWAIKQAAMQQLLAGKIRLPGFSGAWELGKLADLGVFRSGNGFPLGFQGSQSGDYPFFKVSDLSNRGNESLLESANHWISEDVRRTLGATKFSAGSIAFAKIGAAIFLERKRLLSRESCLDNNMMAFSLTAPWACEQFFHYLFLRIQLGKLVSTTALPSLSGREIGGISVSVPPPDEQRAIVTVLSDMGAEIATLEQRRDKTRAIRQGMMQQLLTGRVRLVKPPHAAEDVIC